jgi:deoxyadenosine/deoxycytidine kinase
LTDFPDVHRAADAPFFIRYGLQTVPNILRFSRRDSRQLTRREFAWMIILNGWSSILQKEREINPQVIVLDQGPVYLLAEMMEFGPDYLRAGKTEELWQDLYRRWASTLDMIVWLDAADANLLDRIRTREQEHVVKNESESKMVEFLERYRKAYDLIVSALCAQNTNLRLIKFNTSRQSTKEIAEQLLDELGLSLRSR